MIFLMNRMIESCCICYWGNCFFDILEYVWDIIVIKVFNISIYVKVVKIVKIDIVIYGICVEYNIFILLIFILSLNIVIIVFLYEEKFFLFVFLNIMYILVVNEKSLKRIISLNWRRLLVIICLISFVKKLNFWKGERKNMFNY